MLVKREEGEFGKTKSEYYGNSEIRPTHAIPENDDYLQSGSRYLPFPRWGVFCQNPSLPAGLVGSLMAGHKNTKSTLSADDGFSVPAGIQSQSRLVNSTTAGVQAEFQSSQNWILSYQPGG